MYKRALKKLLFGTTSSQEYLCMGFESLSKKFNVTLSFQRSASPEDVTASHFFLGYKPLVIGIPIKKDNPCHETFIAENNVCMSFCLNTFKGDAIKKGFVTDKKNTARLFLKKIGTKDLGDTSFFILKGTKGIHYFLSLFHQFTNQLLEKFKKKSSGNVGLPGNLYEQIRIAYSIPRIISIISLGKDNLFNLFPTDLHGAVNDNFYVSSLRHEGKACKQVEEIKKITISNVSIDAFREAYEMGKNHTQDLKTIENFETSLIRSEKLNHPLNAKTLSYREVELIDSFDAGIHRLLFYKTINHKMLSDESDTLSHIHQYYYTWRNNKGIKTEIAIR
ncbi:MAG TPA: hypothetical protein VNW06_00135 [Cytophagaceae bacterium]|jgi:hypothetical protein|nr:hypothetical protein [Cytophagaceae bacterium]